MAAVKVEVLGIYDEMVRGFCVEHKRKPNKTERDRLFEKADVKFDEQAKEKENGAQRRRLLNQKVHDRPRNGVHRRRDSFWHL